MRKRLKKHSQGSAQHTNDVEVLFDRRVFDYMLQELSKNLSVEEGGKYVGYLLQTGDPLLERLGSRAGRVIVILDFLPSGPDAVRTAVELRPDGHYQETLFREIENLDSAIEHVGTWHSHHCNGLRRLSDGDIAGYLRTVNNPAYRPDFLVASLVKDVPRNVEDAGWIDHFLFVRGEKGHHRITGAVRFVDLITRFSALTGHALSGREAVQQEQRAASVWYETPEGQRVLAEDKRFFNGSFDSVVATRRDSRVTITGRTGPRTLAATYPHDSADEAMSMIVKVDDSATLRIECALAHRSIAYRAALAALAGVLNEPSF